MKIKLDKNAFMPERAHDTDAGLDLKTPVDFTVWGHSSAIVDTGVHVQLPHGYFGELLSKSGLNMKHSVTTTGVIDEGYTGSVVVKVYNHGEDPVFFTKGQKITQLVVIPCVATSLEVVEDLEETDRGDNGFGSSGV